MSVHVDCIEVKPVSNGRTQYDVTDLTGHGSQEGRYHHTKWHASQDAFAGQFSIRDRT
jgi:hypothetical protein